MRRVIKIGGSLLLQESFLQKLRSWVHQQPAGETFAIVGGGQLIEAVRRLDGVYPNDPTEVHWRCIELLRITFDWLGQQLSDWQLHSTAEQIRHYIVLDQDQDRDSSHRRTAPPSFSVPQIVTNHLVAVDSFYYPGSRAPLPEDWSTTSDAIAGWLSILIDADELVLLKSCNVDVTGSLAELADRGVIDGALPAMQANLPKVRVVNFATEVGQ